MRALILTSVLVVSALASLAEPLDDVGLECKRQLGLSDDGCNCIVEMAAEELSEKQILFLLAKVRRDQQAERDLGMVGGEAMQVVTFINTAPQLCLG
ncbi:MAG: hypothetical protein AAGA71_06245 [Pseudomonadota bacterium]